MRMCVLTTHLRNKHDGRVGGRACVHVCMCVSACVSGGGGEWAGVGGNGGKWGWVGWSGGGWVGGSGWEAMSHEVQSSTGSSQAPWQDRVQCEE